MGSKSMRLDIVSAEQSLFSAEALRVVVSCSMGEVGVVPGHAHFLSALKPGGVRVLTPESDAEEVFYISGGFVEVQPDHITILADVALRGADLDEAEALAAEERAKAFLESGEKKDYGTALAELYEAAARVRLIRSLRDKRK
jgi:F-type H+-transporting ATPase subunit epsilon